MARDNAADLQTLKDLIEAGKVTPVIDTTYTLEQTANALRHVETGHARGKIVVTV
jgi:NADPH:quinone reductase-like Zn-dependent oxidoreductase